MCANVFTHPDVEACVIFGVRPAPALLARTTPLIGGLQTRAIDRESGHREVDNLAHPFPGFRLAGAEGVGISAAQLGIRPDNFLKPPAIHAEACVNRDALLVR